jgi:signal transduction histidine kinase
VDLLSARWRAREDARLRVARLSASTELRDALAALADAEDLLAETRAAESVTRLSRGVAHDLNNVLSVVMLGLGALERKATQPEAVLQSVGNLAEAAESAARLARQLFALGGERTGRADERRAVVDVTMRSLTPALRALVGDLRTLVLSPGATEGAVQLVPAQLEQIVLGLVANARDATGPAGTIEVSSRLATWSPGGPGALAVLLEVRDNGKGMDDATRARVFEPFFSTKRAAGHRGLGLATTRGVVHGLGGTIAVESAPGQGASFKVLLPRLT